MRSRLKARPARVAITGTFDVANFGDLLFPVIAGHELSARLGAVELEVFSYHRRSSSSWPYDVTALEELPDRLADFDLVLVGGGDLVRFDQEVAPGYTPPSPQVRHPLGYWLDPSLMAVDAGVAVAWNAVGSLHDVPAEHQPDVAAALRGASYLAVRDEPTRRRLSDVDPVARVSVRPDTVWGARHLVEAHGNPISARVGVRPGYVMVQACEPLDGVIRSLAAQLGGARDVVVASVSSCLGDDATRWSDVPGVVIAPEWQHPLDLAGLIAGAAAVVCTSLHASIVALACAVPVVRPTADPGSKHAALTGLAGITWFDWATPIGGEAVESAIRGSTAVVWPDASAELDDHWNRVAALVEPSLPTRPRVMRPGRVTASRARERPYRWAEVGGLFEDRDAAELVATFPRDHCKRVEGTDGEKSWSYWCRPLIRIGSERPAFDASLTPIWQRLASDLVSPGYRAEMSHLAGFDLLGCPIEVNCYHYGPNDWLGPHVDLPDKLVTHILYFNERWRRRWGGCFTVLGSARDDDRKAIVLPRAGSSAVVVRSERSWHAVPPVRGGHVRRSVTVTFYAPGSPSTMWPPLDMSPLSDVGAC